MKAAAQCCLLAFILGVLPAPLDAEVGPIRVSQDGRYFVDQASTPFFWLGDTQWELSHAFGVQDAALICENRKNQGFSVLQIMILGVGGGTKPNAQGEKPFVNDDPLTPNERDFAQVDRVVETANQKDLVCAIGIYHKSNDYGRLITQAQAHGWARRVAQRYHRFPNIIWSMYPEAFWIDPKTGERTRIGSYPADGQESFATPAGWDDAVLLVAKPGTGTNSSTTSSTSASGC